MNEDFIFVTNKLGRTCGIKYTYQNNQILLYGQLDKFINYELLVNLLSIVNNVSLSGIALWKKITDSYCEIVCSKTDETKLIYDGVSVIIQNPRSFSKEKLYYLLDIYARGKIV